MKIEGIQDDFKTYVSMGKATTLTIRYGKSIVRKYTTPLLKRQDIINLVDKIHAIARSKWSNLSDVEKEEWETLGLTGQLTGFQLYDQEQFKALVNTYLKKCRVGTAKLGGAITRQV